MPSGEEIKAGRTTTGESTTYIVGAIPSERDVEFNGPVILAVGPQQGRLQPSATIDGFHGVGNSSGGEGAAPGGSGVVGFGGENQGTGVVGLGGGVLGKGGLGIHAIGGSSNGSLEVIPGAGILAQGGRMDGSEARMPHGAGIIAMAGGSKKLPPSPEQTGGVGVFAVGAEAEVSSKNFHGVHTAFGPLFPGAGVIGRGGLPFPRSSGSGAAGVMGLAGDALMPGIGETGNTGVYGRGPIGVQGYGEADRGGVFNTRVHPQVQLVPLRYRAPAELPYDAKAGDLLATSEVDRNGTTVASLWFCKVGGDQKQAIWVNISDPV